MMLLIRYAFGLCVIGLLWQMGSWSMGEELLPNVFATLNAFWEALQTASFWEAVGVSTSRLAIGLFTAIAVSFPLGLWMGHCPKADKVLSPLLFITFPLPKIVLLPVFFTLVGLGDASRILLIGLTVGYQVLVIIRDEALNLDPAYMKAFRSMGGTYCQAIWHVYVPAALPALFTSQSRRRDCDGRALFGRKLCNDLWLRLPHHGCLGLGGRAQHVCRHSGDESFGTRALWTYCPC